MSEFTTLCKTSEIAEGEARAFPLGDRMIGIFHVGGQFFAIDNSCPHAGASLAHGEIEGDVVRCRIHHWRFCLRDGSYVDEEKPCYDARTFPVRVVNGEVQVCLQG